MADQFDVKAFRDFCRSKPAEERYDGYGADFCALAQFGLPHIYARDLGRHGIPLPVYRAAGYEGPFTFGALADRLDALLAESAS